jgi:hypothetical protein
MQNKNLLLVILSVIFVFFSVKSIDTFYNTKTSLNYKVHVGKSSSNIKVITLPGDVSLSSYNCPFTVNKNNWDIEKAGWASRVNDIFNIKQDKANNKITVTRTDVENDIGWGMNLVFDCEKIQDESSPLLLNLARPNEIINIAANVFTDTKFTHDTETLDVFWKNLQKIASSLVQGFSYTNLIEKIVLFVNNHSEMQFNTQLNEDNRIETRDSSGNPTMSRDIISPTIKNITVANIKVLIYQIIANICLLESKNDDYKDYINEYIFKYESGAEIRISGRHKELWDDYGLLFLNNNTSIPDNEFRYIKEELRINPNLIIMTNNITKSNDTGEYQYTQPINGSSLNFSIIYYN